MSRVGQSWRWSPAVKRRVKEVHALKRQLVVLQEEISALKQEREQLRTAVLRYVLNGHPGA